MRCSFVIFQRKAEFEIQDIVKVEVHEAPQSRRLQLFRSKQECEAKEEANWAALKQFLDSLNLEVKSHKAELSQVLELLKILW